MLFSPSVFRVTFASWAHVGQFVMIVNLSTLTWSGSLQAKFAQDPAVQWSQHEHEPLFCIQLLSRPLHRVPESASEVLQRLQLCAWGTVRLIVYSLDPGSCCPSVCIDSVRVEHCVGVGRFRATGMVPLLRILLLQNELAPTTERDFVRACQH
jgi:hypothetical protein